MRLMTFAITSLWYKYCVLEKPVYEGSKPAFLRNIKQQTKLISEFIFLDNPNDLKIKKRRSNYLIAK